MTCRQVRQNLLAWVEGEMDESQWLKLAQHIETCEHCQAEAQKWQRLIATLQAIARNDGVPPVPPKLWHQLAVRRRKLPVIVSLFVTACFAFLLGWSVRSIAVPSMPPQNAFVVERGMGDEEREKTGGQVGKRIGVQGLGLSLRVAPSSLQPSTPLQVRPIIFSGVNGFDRSSPSPISRWRLDKPLALNGATAMALGIGHKRPFCLLPLNSRFAASLPTDGFALDSAEATGQGTDAYQVADEPPYRIFVQVTDLKEQVVRTVLLDRSEPNHVVAEWSEQRMEMEGTTY